jgi:hypothetical protein
MSPSVTEHTAGLKDYREFIAAAAASTATSKVIVSPHDLRAAVVVAELFRRSQRQVDIVTGALDPDIYCEGECIRAARDFLIRHSDAQIRILSEKGVSADHPFIVEMADLGPRVHSLLVPPKLQELYRYQFILGDGHHFRFQPSRDSREALVRFADADNGNKLQLAFDSLYSEVKRAVAVRAAPALSAFNAA